MTFNVTNQLREAGPGMGVFDVSALTDEPAQLTSGVLSELRR
jgi:hypothetical protein